MKWIGRILLALIAPLLLFIAARSGHVVMDQIHFPDEVTTLADHNDKLPLPEFDCRCDLMLPVSTTGVPGIHFQQVAGSTGNSQGHSRQTDPFKRYSILLYGRIRSCSFVREHNISFLAASSLMNSEARRISNRILII